MQIGQKIIRLDRVDSTNNYAANLAKENKIAHGTVILADEQTAGKGQRGAVWVSKPGENLLFSLYLQPDNLSVERQVTLNKLVALALIELLRKIGISATIKWPNDIYVKDQKIAGILIENQLRASRIFSSIIGIGLNVNQMDFSNLQATSIKKCTGEFAPMDSIVFQLIHSLNEQFGRLINEGNGSVDEDYLANLYRLNESAMYEDDKGLFQGIVRGVDESGKLLVEKEGELSAYDLKEIRFISQNAF